MKLICETCGAVDPLDVLFSRGHLWHTRCVPKDRIIEFDDEKYVDFPSSGKLIPETILQAKQKKVMDFT